MLQKLSSETEATVTCTAATIAAFRILVIACRKSGVQGEFREPLHRYIETARNKADTRTLDILHDLHQSLQD
jgi:hypothetical protein